MTEHEAVICWVFDPAARQILLVEHRVFRWSCPGGHVEAGESLAEAAVRELREETGIVAAEPGPPVVVTRNDRCPRDGNAYDVLHHLRFEVAAGRLLGEPGQAIGWFDWDALPAPRVADLDVLLPRIRG